MKETLLLSHFTMKKPSKFSWKTRWTPHFRPAAPCGACPSPLSAGPLLGLDRDASALQGGETRPLLSNPFLSCPLSGLHLPHGAPGSAQPSPPQQLPGLGRVPRCWAAPQQSPRPRPCLWIDQSSGAGHGCTQSERGPRARLRVPPPGLQHPSDSGPGGAGPSRVG